MNMLNGFSRFRPNVSNRRRVDGSEVDEPERQVFGTLFSGKIVGAVVIYKFYKVDW